MLSGLVLGPRLVSDPPVLVVIPCGRSKIWDREPTRGSVSAAEAYTGTLFQLNRQCAEGFGDAWVILSARYGFIAPDFMIPEPHEVSFKHPATHPIAFDRLREQLREQQLGSFPIIVGLWNKRLRDRARQAPQEKHGIERKMEGSGHVARPFLVFMSTLCPRPIHCYAAAG
jgi:hypothetical protein